MFLTVIWNAITGNLSGIVSAVVGTIGKLSDNDTAKFTQAVGADKDVAVAQLQAASAQYHDRVDLMKGLKLTQWLLALALIPPLYHQGMIFLDSSPLPWHEYGAWAVPKAPAPYDEREWSMIASILGIQSAVTVGLGAVKMLMRK